MVVAIGKGVFGGPSGPSPEGPSVGHKIVSDTKQNKREKKKKKNEWEKGKMCKEKNRKREEIKKCSKTRTETEILTC